MRLAASPSRFVVLWFMGVLILGGSQTKGLWAQEAPLSEEEKREQVAAERFLELLLKRPTTGTALERVFGYHVARGDLGELLAGLEKKAKAGDDQSAGNHWMVIGLLQLQRGEDAQAADALAQAEARLKTNPLTAYHHGQALLLLGKEEAAAQAMQRAIDLKPPRQDFLNIATQLGSLYQRSGQTEAAMGIWKQLEDSYPGDDGVRQRIARALADEGDLAGALKRYEDLAKAAKSPNDRIVFALRAADLRVQLGQKTEARKDLESLLAQLRPGSYLYAEARRRIETAFLDSGDYAGLAEYYEKWIADHPDDVGAVLHLARTLSVQGRGAESLKWLEKAIERSPSDSAPRLTLIDTYIAEARYADAAAQYEKLAEMEPKNPDHLVRWGQIILEDPKAPKEEKKAKAAEIWKRLADARPNDAVIQSQVADLLRGAERKEQAIASYRKAIALAPNEPQYKEYLGEYLHRLDRHQEALPIWRSIAERELRTRENLVRLAEVLHQFEEPEEAVKTLGQACEMNPTITERLRYAEWLRDDGEFDSALKQLELAGDQTDTVDDRDKVFTEEVKTYQAAGQLEDRIQEARNQAETKMTDGEAWRRLAILSEANNQTRESLEAIEQALEHSGNSIETLDVAARMYESAGRLQDSIEKRKLLADSDRRFRSGHLQRLASLYLRLGQAEEAIATGKLLLAGGGGSLDSFKFYADLCGQIGRTEERLDTFRRCLRVNPKSSEALQLLASQLSEDFKTDQAIELYWKMLDSSRELEDRRGVVRSLTDLYLRSNRLDQLISRLEIRGRESGDRRATIDLIATAHEQAGDLGLAREALEGLLREQGRDTLLLDRLVALAEQAGEAEAAVELQRQLLRLAPGRQSEAKLASLLIDIGAMDEAEALWLRLSELSGDKEVTARNLNRLFAAGETGVALRLAKKVLESDPGDWEARLQLMVLEASEGQWEQAAQTAKELRKMDIEDTALPAGGKPYQATRTINGQTYQQPPLKFMRSQQLYSLYQMLDERYGYRQRSALPTPLDFGHAKLMALWVVLKEDQSHLKTHLEEAEKKAKADGATVDDVWDWYNTVNVARSMDTSVALNYQKPETWEPLWKLVEVDPQAGSMALVSMLYNRWSTSIRGRDVALSPLAEDKLTWLKEQAAQADSSNIPTSWYGNFSWPMIYDSEMRIAGHEDNAAQGFKEYFAEVLKKKDLKQAVSLVTMALYQGDDEQLWSLLELLRNNPQDPLVKSRYSSGVNASCLAMFASQDRIDKNLTKGPKDASYRQRVMALLDAMLAEEAAKPVKRNSVRMSSLGQPRSSYVMRGQSYEEVVISFPPQGIGPNDEFIRVLWTLNQLLKAQAPTWAESLQTEDKNADPRLRILRNIAAGSVLQWNEQTGQAIKLLSESVRIAEKEAPHYEPELRLMWVDLLLRQEQKRQALDVIDGLTVYDQNTMAIREFAAAKLAAALGDKERAQAAAKRLFGVRMDTDTQIELAKLMRSLDMHELSSDLVRRMRSRGGSNVEQLNSLMTYFVAQGDKEQAGAVAIDILRRSQPNRRQSSNYTTVTEARRRSALQTLANVGRLTSLIETTEERLKHSPKSQRIRGELAEMYVSAGQSAKAQKLLGETLSGDLQSLNALELAAKQLASAGKMDEACDAYLKVLRRKPELFDNDYYTVVRPFQQKQRLGDLADLIVEVGVARFRIYRVGELCQELSRDAKQSEKYKPLFLAMLEMPPTSANAMQALHRVVSYSRTTLKDTEVIAKVQDYMIQASLNSTGDWAALFSGYSTSGDGRHKNAAMSFIEAVGAEEKQAQALEDQIRKTLKEHEDWYEGRAWLGTLLVQRKQYEEAKKLLEPLLDEDTKPAPGYTVFWLIGSLIDTHKPMQDLALKMYQHALANHAAEIYQRGSEFEFSLANRACQLLKDMNKKPEARELLMSSIDEMAKTPSRYSSNDDYEAYRKIRHANSLIVFLKEIEYPADALRLARNLDMSLFDKAGQYERGMKDQFIKQRNDLLNQVRKLGGLSTVESMIDAGATGLSAVDLGITVGERPFTETGIQSLWIDLLADAGNQPEQAGQFQALIEQLKTLKDNRKQDDSVALALAIALDIAKDPKPLRELLQNWTANTDEKQINDPLLRRQCEIVGLVYLGRSHADDDRKLATAIASGKLTHWSWEQRMLLLAELGKQALGRSQPAEARSLWEPLLQDPQSQLILLDLAHAAASSQMPELSCAAASAAAAAPEKTLSTAAGEPKANSLGSLLSTGNRQSSSSSSNGQTQLDPAEVRLAKRLMELDQVWQANQTAPRKVCEALMKIVFGENGTKVNLLCTPVESRANNNLAIDSVFDRLARRAKEAKITDQILAKLPKDEAVGHLLSGLALLRNDQSEEAQKHYAQVDPTQLKALAKETVIQSLLPALSDAVCRAEILRIGVAFVGQNKPTQRYQDIDPFDILAFKLGQSAIQNGHNELGLQAINDYLEISQHQNDRYSGTSGLSMRISQLNNVSRVLANKGHIEKALSFAGMRQSLFEMGLDTANDAGGLLILQRVEGLRDRKKAYRWLSDWTFAGDGPLGQLSAIAYRQPLPEWVPEAMGGKYPTFSPVASQTFPIVSNWYSLAKLAVETNQTDDLLQRLKAAHQKHRAGSAEALAIALAVAEQPVSQELLAEIGKRMDEIGPETNQVKFALPLPTMQLATILAQNPEHADWSRALAKNFEKLGNPSGRVTLMRWLDRYQYEQGWSRNSELKPAALVHWLSSSSANARDYAEGLTPPVWLTDGKSRINHLCGIAEDRFWFRYPLEGDYEFQVELSDGNWSESSVLANGLRFSPVGASKSFEVGANTPRDWLRFSTAKIKNAEWNQHAFKFEGDTFTYSINSTVVYKEPRQKGSPWIALQSQGLHATGARNLRFTGDPRIVRSLNLLPDNKLRDWSGQYHAQKLPTAGLNQDVHEPDAADPRVLRTSVKPNQLATLAWTLKDGELISGNAAAQGAAGRKGQSVIRYDRPLADGETLSYEFYYEAGKSAVHPAIGRTAYLLTPDGVHLHWMTEPQKSWKLPHDNEFPLNAENPVTVPLKESAWNRIRLHLNKNQLKIHLNDELVFDQPIAILPQGTIFGLFHYADKTKARVRNIILTGPWPESIPEDLFGESDLK